MVGRDLDRLVLSEKGEGIQFASMASAKLRGNRPRGTGPTSLSVCLFAVMHFSGSC